MPVADLRTERPAQREQLRQRRPFLRRVPGWRCSRFCVPQIPPDRASREREPLNAVRHQLEMFGLDGARLCARAAGSSQKEHTRLVRRVETAHEIMSAAEQDHAF